MKTMRFTLFFIVLMISFLLSSCKKEVEIPKSIDTPDLTINSSDGDIDFILLHNGVLTNLMSEANPFFYIKEGEFDISGDNDNKNILIKCTCINGTTVEDLDLFLSRVLCFIGIECAEQNFKFKTPIVSKEGNYQSFGTVFDTYSLEFDCKTENGTILRSEKIKAGEEIPVDPRYWNE